MERSSLGDRMKRYEKAGATNLTPRTPVIIRMDGKAFHTFTKHITPEMDPTESSGFGQLLHNVMAITTRNCCANMQGAVLAYTQSDEISIVLRDWDTYETQPWFGGQLQKIVSVSASLATAYFNDAYYDAYGGRAYPPALFDARAFTLPLSEVNNYFVWRQQDAIRNSVQFLGHKHFSQTEMYKRNVSDIKNMLAERGIDWDAIEPWKQRGTCVIRVFDNFIDEYIPIFSTSPSYITNLL